MKKILLLLILISLTFSSYAQEVKVMTYNIKYDKVDDTVNNWDYRKADMVKLINHYNASFVGAQEVLHRQLTYLDSSLTSYSYVGVGRDDGKEKGEYAPIFFNSSKYKVLKSKTFWLSDTPEKVSKGWDASLERICTYALFEEIGTGKQIYIFNTHFDHRGVVAREKSVELIYKKIQEINKEQLPVVLMGDLNLPPESKPIQFLQSKLDDGKNHTKATFYGPSGTHHGFNHSRILNHRIDYIFVKNLDVLNYIHIDDRMENNMHISDHLPILATLEIE